ncbi:glycolate oxidase iron-sulfur subunit [Nitrosomonas marina]|uniref:Glycolate oxidase iron-sulfur subunit n=1 Tax=Nitrosomonas marina TaxID=917 RepID=A0A1H9ZJ35_9PROT|nr:(Fe-S)-binding protein [Nitrosomonas marina]SES81519.1 glycolate oxidase iron-sulfur subunit [Nitrosomonas marina]
MTECNTDDCLHDEADLSSSEHITNNLVEQTSRCVSCGLCLPHCPTYRLLESEADSPRGRIAIINGAVKGRIPMNEKFKLHLDRCLACRTCEAVCPNHVAYGQIIDEARRMIRKSETNHGEENSAETGRLQMLRLLSTLAMRPEWFDRLRWLLYLFKKSGVLSVIRWVWQHVFRNRFGMQTVLTQLPPVVFPFTGNQSWLSVSCTWRDFYPATGESRGTVELFLGCIARLTDAATLNASIYILNRLGYSVRVPSTQTCCGALHQHAGDAEKAAQLRDKNMQALGASDAIAIISVVSGCGAQLSEYTDTLTNSKGKKVDGNVKFPEICDISKFLAATQGWDQLAIAPLTKKIAVHDPCSLRHVLRDHDYPYQIIRKIPGAQLVFLADNDQCCGAAGTYFIRQPELAGRLLDGKINAVKQCDAEILVTSNVGCAMHIAARLRESGSEIEVMHPVTLLARQIQHPTTG